MKLSTPARNALLQLYRLGFLWYDGGKEDEWKAITELVDGGCAVVVDKSLSQSPDSMLPRRIEITLRGIEMAVLVYDDQQRAINRINRGEMQKRMGRK